MMTNNHIECVTVAVGPDKASFQFDDAAEVEVTREMLSRSSLLVQTLSETDKANNCIRLETPSGFLKTWLQWVNQDTLSDSGDAKDLIQYLLAADFLIDKESVKTLCRQIAMCLFGPDRRTGENLQVLEELPSNLQDAVLASMPNTLLSLLPVIPPHLHMDALHAVYPSIASHASLTMLHRDAASDSENTMWALLPKLSHLKHFELKNTSGDIHMSSLLRNLAKLSELTHLSLHQCLVPRDGHIVLGPVLMSLEALQHLSLVGNNLGSEGFTALPRHVEQLTSLTHLDISSNGLGLYHAQALAPKVPALASLRELLLDNNPLTCKGVMAFAEYFDTLSSLQLLSLQHCQIFSFSSVLWFDYIPRLRCLQRLLLSGNDCSFIIFESLGEGLNHLPDLQCLNLRSLGLPASGIDALLRPLKHYIALRQLNLRDNCLCNQGAESLAVHLPKLIHLELLDIRYTELNARGMGAIARSLEKLNQFKVLYFGDFDLDCASAAAMLRHVILLPYMSQLHLDMFDMAVAEDSAGATELLNLLVSLPSLAALSCDTCIMPTLEHVRAFVLSLPVFTGLEKLHLIDLGFGLTAAQLIAQHITALNMLSSLNLSSNPLGPQGMKALAPALRHLTALKALHIAWCGIAEEGASALTSCLSSLQSLKTLNLDGNKLKDAGAAVLSQHLIHLTSLEKLSLVRNSITIRGYIVLGRQAVSIRSLSYVNLTGNYVIDFCSVDDAKLLDRLVPRNWIIN